MSCLLLLQGSSVLGLQPSTQISQYGHTAWRFGQNGLDTVPTSIAQTADGYLWVGTVEGLFRFDGSRFERWFPPEGERLFDFDQRVTALLGAHDGSLYVASKEGVARITQGHIYRYPEGPKFATSLIEDVKGAIWTGESSNAAALSTVCKIGETHLTCFGVKDGLICRWGYGLATDRAGSIWIGSQEGICRLQQNEKPHNYPFRSLSKMEQSALSIAIDPQGSLWAAVPDTGPGWGLLKFTDGAWKSYVTPKVDGSKISARDLFFDHDGNLWIGTPIGLSRLSNGELSSIDSREGLTGNAVRQIFEDREHTLWVVTDQGVDSFRDLTVVSFSPLEGPSSISASAVVVTPDGTAWVGTNAGLWTLRDGHFSSIPVAGKKGVIAYLFVDSHKQLWVAQDEGLYVLNGQQQFEPVKNGDNDSIGRIIEMEEDGRHQLWASAWNQRLSSGNALLRIEGLRVAERYPSPAAMNHQSFNALEPNSGGGFWVVGDLHGLYWFHDGQTEQVKPKGYNGQIWDITVDKGGALWMSTLQDGAIRYLDGRSKVLTSADGLPCNEVLSVIDDHAGAHWFFTQCGIISKISDSELSRWWSGSNSPIHVVSYGPSDGARSGFFWARPYVASDGRIWSANGSVIQVFDPQHLPFNPIPPPVQIQQLLINHEGRPLDNGLKLPVSPREVQIDYVALSYVEPEKVRFRYQLVGYDKDWTDAGTRRQAFYNDLAPGRYTFRVIACNNDGVWNTKGAALEFTVPPAWFQTLWFRLLCVVLATALAYFIYVLRMRQYAARMKMRFNERLDERTRLARDLHDTLMQTIQGSRIVAENAHESTRDLASAKSALALLSEWLGRATLEGRAALDSLRSSTIEENDLAASFRHSFDNYIKDDRMTVNVCVSGKSKEMHPIARDEVYRIGDEAIRNACLHSGGTRVDIELLYDQNMELRVRDDGKGIDAETLEAGKSGHYGLTGMRERADRIGATLSLESSSQGTEIVLSVPGKAIYQPPSAQIKRLLKGKNRSSNVGGSH